MRAKHTLLVLITTCIGMVVCRRSSNPSPANAEAVFVGISTLPTDTVALDAPSLPT